MKAKTFLIFLLLTSLLGCKSFTQEGRSLNQARRAGRGGDYPEAVTLAIRAINMDGEFYEAMSYLSGIFNEGTLHYRDQIFSQQASWNSFETLQGDVYLPVDLICDSYINLDKMHRAVEAAGYQRMYDKDEDLTYLCEVDYFEIELGEWKEKATSTHYDAVVKFLGENHPMSAKLAHKHALYLRSHYDSAYLDIAALEEQALEEAQITLSVGLRQDFEAPFINRQKILDGMMNTLSKNPDIMTYATLRPWQNMDNIFRNSLQITDEEIAQIAGNESIDYLLLMDIKSGRTTFEVTSSRKEENIRDTLDTTITDEKGSIENIISNLYITQVTHELNASVTGYARLFESSSARDYKRGDLLVSEQQESLEYEIIQASHMNALLTVRSERQNESIMQQAKESFNNRTINHGVILNLSAPLAYLEQGDDQSEKFLSLQEIYSTYFGTDEKNYLEYKNQVEQYMENPYKEENILENLWTQLSVQCFNDMVPFLN
ncbi:MAG: hypothetical protein PF447_13660 [Spirochaetaceae bacterium]|jgi:hypothetical protein|nr:hypothetical protein [Spirochaetaceae bacterium]